MYRIRFKRKPTWHETEMTYDGRPVLIAEGPNALLLRRKGTRMTLELPYGVAYLRAATLKAAVIRLEKINAKRSRNVVRRGGVIRG